MPQRGHQKTVSVRLYPKEIQACEVIAKLAGWNGKSQALREFMKIWIECAIVAIESESQIKGSIQMMKSMTRVTKQMDAVAKGAQKLKEEDLFHEHHLQTLKEALSNPLPS